MAGPSRFPAVRALCAGLAWVALTAGAVEAQTRGECEDGIRFIRDALARATEAQRPALTKALRDAERELGEGEFDECLDAVEDAKTVMAGQTPPERAREAPEHLGADPNLPVTVEDAFVPRPGEIEAKAGFTYDRFRRRTPGDEDDLRNLGRDRYSPRAEIEAGALPGLALSLGTAYRFGNADDAKSGDVEVGAKWNFLGAKAWWPALTFTASVALPYGNNNETTETTLGLLASLPLGKGENAPWLHANIEWSRAFNIEEDEERRNMYAAVLGIAVPVAERTGLIFDVVREQESEKGRYNNLLEAGVRHVLPGDLVLAAGAGVGFGNSETDFRFLLGIQKSF